MSIVGYTNAGKSSLLNALTGTEAALAEDRLFATLDPTSRSVKLGDGQTVIMTDTVGFIHKLPHQLVDAFRATLEEVARADVLVARGQALGLLGWCGRVGLDAASATHQEGRAGQSEKAFGDHEYSEAAPSPTSPPKPRDLSKGSHTMLGQRWHGLATNRSSAAAFSWASPGV